MHDVRVAALSDAPVIGQLLHDFNAEFDTPTPEPGVVAHRIAELMEAGDTAVVLGSVRGDSADGGDSAGADDRPDRASRPHAVAVLRFRRAIFSAGLECYLAELYVVPEHRGQGLGKAMMERVLEVAEEYGADTIELGTSADDTAAMGLYRRMGFTDREGGPDGPVMFVFERDLPRGAQPS